MFEYAPAVPPLADWMSVPLLLSQYSGKAPKRVGLSHSGIAPYGAYNTGDNKVIVISIQNEREWFRLCSEVLQNTKLSSDDKYINNSNRVKNRIQLDEIINSTFLKFKRDEIIKKMTKAQIAFGKLSSIEDLTNHPQSIFVEINKID